jgi:hypothetical protein
VRAAWYKDWIGDALVGAGVTAGIAGGLVLRAAHADRDAADRASSYGAYKTLDDRAHGKQTIAIGLAAGGGALIAAGVVHYVVHHRGEERATIAVSPTRSGGVVTWELKF